MALSRIFVDRSVADHPGTAAFLSRAKAPATVVDDALEVYREVRNARDPVGRGKEILFLTRNRGAFVRPCPGTRAYTCCGYMILHIGTFCVMDCSYCILQSYFHPPVLTYFVNHEDLFAELGRLFAEKSIRRIGTGEYTDSMIWERWTPLSEALVPAFARQSHTILELKTKTVRIEALERLEHNRRTLVAWSVNTPRVIGSEERGTTPLSARLEAAARCQSWGYPLAFHFDPMVLYEGCEAEYRDVVERIFSRVRAEDVAWISLGTFRFMPALKAIIQERFADSRIVYGEFVQGLDNKMRYFKPLRIELYRKMVAWIRDRAPDVLVYFCMEDDEVWRKCTGGIPDQRGGLPRMLDERVVSLCGLDRDPG